MQILYCSYFAVVILYIGESLFILFAELTYTYHYLMTLILVKTLNNIERA